MYKITIPKYWRWFKWLLDKVPFKIVWFLDEHLNHSVGYHCVSETFCLYTDFRCFEMDYYWDRSAKIWRERKSTAEGASESSPTPDEPPSTSGS